MSFERFINKKASTILFIGFLLIIGFFLEYYFRSQNIDNFGVNIIILFWIFAISEVFFNLGVALMLIGSGLRKVGIRNIIKFNFL